jgi:hypothetical protein
MDAEHFESRTAIGLSSSARDAGPAGKIRHHRDAITGHKSAIARSLCDLPGELVADEPWIGQERLLTTKDVEVRSADTDAPNTNQNFVFSARWSGPVLNRQAAGLCTYDG